jgi:hypothetical protein
MVNGSKYTTKKPCMIYLLKTKERQKEGTIEIEDTQRLVTQRLKCSELYCIWWQVEVGKNRRRLSLFDAMLY